MRTSVPPCVSGECREGRWVGPGRGWGGAAAEREEGECGERRTSGRGRVPCVQSRGGRDQHGVGRGRACIIVKGRFPSFFIDLSLSTFAISLSFPLPNPVTILLIVHPISFHHHAFNASSSMHLHSLASTQTQNSVFLH